jgi:hypothetical protein
VPGSPRTRPGKRTLAPFVALRSSRGRHGRRRPAARGENPATRFYCSNCEHGLRSGSHQRHRSGQTPRQQRRRQLQQPAHPASSYSRVLLGSPSRYAPLATDGPARTQHATDPLQCYRFGFDPLGSAARHRLRRRALPERCARTVLPTRPRRHPNMRFGFTSNEIGDRKYTI